MAVLFEKERSHIETVNDLNGEVVNFFRILRDFPEELQRKVEQTPYSREEYENAYTHSADAIERARRFCVRCWMGFGCSNLYKNGFKSGQQTKSPNPAVAWSYLPKTLDMAAGRPKGVQIEQLPAVELLKRYDTPDVFIYLDPPYLHETRKNYLYKHEMSDWEHEELLSIITSHKGRMLISGYDSELYNSYLKGWQKVYKSTQAEKGLKRIEVLWMNYHIGQMNLKDFI